MHFHKFLHPANFEFPGRVTPAKPIKTSRGRYRMEARASAEDIYHIRVTGQGWDLPESEIKLRLPKVSRSLEGKLTRLIFAEDGTLTLRSKTGKSYLSSGVGRCFGQCGEASLFEFVRQQGDQFYGLGEKWSGLEHSGKKTKFWNTDIWADFHRESFINGDPAPDPAYVSIPYLILKRGNTYVGLLLDNPHATFVSTGAKITIANQKQLKSEDKAIHLGAEQGQPNLYILFGPSLPELTRKFQKLVGVTPLPPAWALGYHQCRWGYQSEADLQHLDRSFRKHHIPVDGLWLDIDYMRGYRVFTFDSRHFPQPKRAFQKLNEAGRRVVPILDPGVKSDPGFGVYQRGRSKQAFCLNPQKHEYIGLVWPGTTAFPDFSMTSARAWWASEVAAFARLGIYGAWLDMNDPSTGQVDNQDMLFQKGRKDHSFYHNQYALGMAMASRQGFLEAHPEDRPFLLSRSGYTGSGRFAAIWTGDNVSNYHHLKNSIAITLNLALSGIPFNGADVAGFGGDAKPELTMDWFKAAFLFPFFRNHSICGSRQQEPWAFGAKTLTVLRRYIQLRYRLRPYLYQLFVAQERSGEAIMRPLFYDFQDTATLPLGLIDDQFMVGPALMQAPFVTEKQKIRDVVLPGANHWFSVMEGKWFAGGKKISVKAAAADTPLYIRDGSILPLASGPADANAFHADKIDFHIFLSHRTEAKTRYVFDDGATFSYKKGKRSEIEITATRKGRAVEIKLVSLSAGFGAGSFTYTLPAEIGRVTVNGVVAQTCSSQGMPLGPAKTKTWHVAGKTKTA